MAAETAGQARRVPQAERTARMRARLARAAYEAIRDGGYVHFRTAAVARLAGVSQGAQLHHFPTKNSLALAAIEHAWQSATAESLARIARHRAGQDVIEAIVADSRAFFFSEYFRVALDILMAGGRDDALREPLVASTLAHRHEVEQGWHARLVASGYAPRDADDLLALTLSVVRGFAVRALVEPRPAMLDRLCRRWVALVRAAGLASTVPPRPRRAARAAKLRGTTVSKPIRQER